ncbi:hypothetical protein ACFSSA_06690 [Luteolibacter algae]|uniref:Uncharacterized protein n=1 Tax=Luteolibacter algae TaxID=454151 RepID=A0ABW5D6I2_9BACT
MKTDTKKYRIILNDGSQEIASWTQDEKPPAGLGEHFQIPEKIRNKYPSLSGEAMIFRIELDEAADIFYADVVREHALAY